MESLDVKVIKSLYRLYSEVFIELGLFKFIIIQPHNTQRHTKSRETSVIVTFLTFFGTSKSTLDLSELKKKSFHQWNPK